MKTILLVLIVAVAAASASLIVEKQILTVNPTATEETVALVRIFNVGERSVSVVRELLSVPHMLVVSLLVYSIGRAC